VGNGHGVEEFDVLGSALSAADLTKAINQSLSNFGIPSKLILSPFTFKGFTFEYAPKGKKARSLWTLIGVLRGLDVLDKDHERHQDDCTKFARKIGRKVGKRSKRKKKEV
jgi:hypothetical protein